jgi:hypothetical protein
LDHRDFIVGDSRNTAKNLPQKFKQTPRRGRYYITVI